MAKLTPYISYDNTKKAIKYYEKFFKATGSFRMAANEEMAKKMELEADIEDTTIHGGFYIYDNLILCSDKVKYEEEEMTKRMRLSINFNGEDKKLYDLYNSIINAEGIEILMELKEESYGGKAAQVVDKFGILWMLHS